MGPYSLLYILDNILWTPYPSHPSLSSILIFHYYYFLILLMTVILVDTSIILELFAQLKFHIHLEILDTILLFGLIEFVILNGWYSTMIYW